MICLVLCMISGIKIQAAQPGYFDNPQTVYDEFTGKIYDRSFKKSYAFLKKKMNVYETTPESPEEASDIRAQRRYGNNYAGYSKAISNKEIIKQLK